MAFLKKVFRINQQGDTPSPLAGAAEVPEGAAGAPMSPQAAFAFADFEVGRTLGTGTFGRVNLVRHVPTGAYYAMKKMKKAEIVRLRQVEHTNNERHLLGLVAHPFLVNLVCTFQDAYSLYIVLEYVAGGELFSLLRKVKVLPPFVAQFYAAEVVLALEYLHSLNIVYRDLKPENILIRADGHISLTDFGFAKVIAAETYTICGTPDYLAPEVALSQGYGKAVDAYALGILIYEMLVGMPPFYHESQAQLYDNIINKAPPFPMGFDPVARDLIGRLLEKDPAMRLGNFVGGIAQIKGHPWFRDVNWHLLADLAIRPPFKPKVAHLGDASNFDVYPEEEEADAAADPSQMAHPSIYEGLFDAF